MLNYAYNEGLKASWKGALLGGIIGGGLGYQSEASRNYPAADLNTIITVTLLSFFGVTGGTIAGFTLGPMYGLNNWAFNGPFDTDPRDASSIRTGAFVTETVANIIFNNARDDD